MFSVKKVSNQLRKKIARDLSADGRRVRKEWRVEDLPPAWNFVDELGHIAEEEDHHPDLHLVDYRNVTVELLTRAAGGLTENDFVVAAKIDELPVRLKS